MNKLLSFIAGVALLAGCSRNNGPTVNLVTVHFKEASALETTSEFIIRLSNDSPEARKFTGGAHKIYINGLYVGKGLSAEPIEVPRLGTVTQAVTVHLSNLALATRVKAVIEAKSFEYRLQSTFFGDSIFSRMHSETTGRLDLKDFTPTEANEPPVENQPTAPPLEPSAGLPPPPAADPAAPAEAPGASAPANP
jgi:LEA14-like dessication related protein